MPLHLISYFFIYIICFIHFHKYCSICSQSYTCGSNLYWSLIVEIRDNISFFSPVFLLQQDRWYAYCFSVWEWKLSNGFVDHYVDFNYCSGFLDHYVDFFNYAYYSSMLLFSIIRIYIFALSWPLEVNYILNTSNQYNNHVQILCLLFCVSWDNSLHLRKKKKY